MKNIISIISILFLAILVSCGKAPSNYGNDLLNNGEYDQAIKYFKDPIRKMEAYAGCAGFTSDKFYFLTKDFGKISDADFFEQIRMDFKLDNGVTDKEYQCMEQAVLIGQSLKRDKEISFKLSILYTYKLFMDYYLIINKDDFDLKTVIYDAYYMYYFAKISYPKMYKYSVKMKDKLYDVLGEQYDNLSDYLTNDFLDFIKDNLIMNR